MDAKTLRVWQVVGSILVAVTLVLVTSIVVGAVISPAATCSSSGDDHSGTGGGS